MVMTVASSWAVTVLHCPWCCITKNAHIVMKFSSSNFHKVDIHEWWYYWYLLGKSIVLYCAPPLHTYAHANSASTLAPLTSPTYLIWSVKVSCFWCRDVAEIASFCLQRGLLNSTQAGELFLTELCEVFCDWSELCCHVLCCTWTAILFLLN